MCHAMSVVEAANHLNVTPRQVQRLVATGDLLAQRGVGDSWMLDGSAVRERARLGVGPGRTWNPRTAWAAMELVATGSTTRVHGSALSRLRRSVRSMSAEEFVRQAQGRSQTRRVNQTRRRREALGGELRLTGAPALVDPNLARSLGLTPGIRKGTVFCIVCPRPLPPWSRRVPWPMNLGGPHGVCGSLLMGSVPRGPSCRSCANCSPQGHGRWWAG